MSPDELRELQELAHQLEELTRHPGWPILVHYSNYGAGGMDAQQKRLIGGHCESQEEYKRLAGWVAGANHVLTAPIRVRDMADKYSAKEVVT